MGLRNGFMIVIMWMTLVTVSPYPADSTDSLFSDSDLSIPEDLSDSGDWLISDSPSTLDGTDGLLTALPPSNEETLDEQWMDLHQWNGDEGSDLDPPLVPSEPIGVASTMNEAFVAMDPSDCTANPVKRDGLIDMTLGTFTDSSFVHHEG